jgi:DNA-binding HxlR family transcriptional regulator
MHRVLELLKDRERVLIICQLSHGERSIAELESMTGLKAKRVSLHLQRLHDDGLVLTRRFADKLYFMPVGDEEQRLMQELYDMLCTPIVQQCRASNDPAY